MNILNNPIRYLLLSSMLLFSALASAELETIYYHNDHLGNPVAATSATGELMWQEEFTPYGTRQIKQDGGLNHIWYTGKELDADTGLVYFGARWYDPSIGQFLSVDPVGVIPGNRFSYNRYAYANNNPHKYIDPDGRFAFLAAIPWVVGTVSAFMTGYELGSTGYGLSTGAISPSDLAGDVGQELAINTGLKAIPGGAAVVAAKKLGIDSFVGSVTKGGGQKLLPAPKAKGPKGNTNGAPENGTIFVDSKGNAIPTPPGGRITGSPDGRFIQARNANGNPTGVRIDGGHSPKTHTDPRALGPHGHVPGVTNADGTPWLPIKQ